MKNLDDIVARTQALYAKDKAGADMITTGACLKRPVAPEEFVLAPRPDHPWVKLTGLLGMPYNHILQVAGGYDAGKSTLAGEFMAAAQKQGIYVILGDSEKAFDSLRFEKYFGGNASQLLLVSSTAIRKLAGGMFKYIDTIKASDPSAKIFLVHDSIGGSISRARAEHDIDSKDGTQPATEAVENSDYMKHLEARIDKYPDSIAVLLVNQMTDKIGFGQKGQARSGGHKLSFHSSVIVEMKKIKTVTRTVNKVVTKTGIVVRAKIDKNRLSTTETSVHEMNIAVTVSGWNDTDFTFDKDGNS